MNFNVKLLIYIFVICPPWMTAMISIASDESFIMFACVEIFIFLCIVSFLLWRKCFGWKRINAGEYTQDF